MKEEDGDLGGGITLFKASTFVFSSKHRSFNGDRRRCKSENVNFRPGKRVVFGCYRRCWVGCFLLFGPPGSRWGGGRGNVTALLDDNERLMRFMFVHRPLTGPLFVCLPTGSPRCRSTVCRDTLLKSYLQNRFPANSRISRPCEHRGEFTWFEIFAILSFLPEANI